MLILASILLSRSSNTTGSFSALPDAVFSSSFPRDVDPTTPCPRQRIQIIWTCIATILAASWVSVHPNIPNPKEPAILKTLRRIEMMIWAIITPELIIFWAMRQWHSARSMEREFARYQRRLLRQSGDTELTPLTRRQTPHRMKKVKWTRTHSFFLQMGGFMLHEEGQKDRVLGWRTFMKHYKQGRLDLSGITEDRINDQSKADGFAKALALLQMFWFIIQCIARFFDKHLVLTEFELVTAALALLSLVMYFLWWNKPFNVGVPITITLLPEETDPESKDGADADADAVNPHIPHVHSADEATPVPVVETNYSLRQSDPADTFPTRSEPLDDDTFSQTLPALPPSPSSAHPRVLLVSNSSGTDPHALSARSDGFSQPVDVAPVSIPQSTASAHRAQFTANDTDGDATSAIVANLLASNDETSSLLNAGEGISKGLSPTRGLSHLLLPDAQRAGRPPRSPSIESDDSSDGFRMDFLFLRIREILSGGTEDRNTPEDEDPFDVLDDSVVTSVPSFYSVPADSSAAYLQMGLASFSAASLFGSIHCIGWSSKIVFASHVASLAWRIASVVITASPMVWFLTFVFGYAGDAEGCEGGCVSEDTCYYLGETGLYVSVVTIPVYIVARLVLLVLALVELRNVPTGALASIQWANVLPFIH
ncbi:hypothetical protein CPC08DRAFT_99773 [Agrocybe pediades]|nr:hypothetical protein CPC08DRAFT_99773 [Agrocybe pediades]